MNYETKEIKTKRLIMKRGKKDDYMKVYEYDFSELKGIDGIVKFVKKDLKRLELLFKNGMKRYFSKLKKGHMFDWIIYLNDNPIGNILTGDEDVNKKEIEVSFNIHPSYWGKGYMPEALEGVIEYLYLAGYDNIVCAYYDGNIKAKRVLDKLGFKPYKLLKDSFKSKNGNLVDEYKVIMTKEDWFSKTGRLDQLKVLKDSL